MKNLQTVALGLFVAVALVGVGAGTAHAESSRVAQIKAKFGEIHSGIAKLNRIPNCTSESHKGVDKNY